MKYIRHRKLGFVVFEGSVRHAEVAESLGGAEEIMSAGFIVTPAVDLRCVGHSSSLNLGVLPRDGEDLQDRLTSF